MFQSVPLEIRHVPIIAPSSAKRTKLIAQKRRTLQVAPFPVDVQRARKSAQSNEDQPIRVANKIKMKYI